MTLHSNSKRAVVLAFDDRIAKHSVRVLKSLSRHAALTERVYILARDWRPWTREFYLRLDLPKLDIRIVDVSQLSVVGPIKLLTHTTIASMDRLFIPDLLTEEERVVYLDVDMVTLGSLDPLFEMSLPKTGLAAKPSIAEKFSNLAALIEQWCPKEFRNPLQNDLPRSPALETVKTFNSGVLVLDLNSLREGRFVEKTLGYAKRYGVPDQLAICLYAFGDFGELDAKWNVFVGQDAPADPHVVHWAGRQKPWGFTMALRQRCRPTRRLYMNEWNDYRFDYRPFREWFHSMAGRQSPHRNSWRRAVLCGNSAQIAP